MIDWVWRLKERERHSSPASGFLAGEIGWMLLAFPEIEITGLFSRWEEDVILGHDKFKYL